MAFMKLTATSVGLPWQGFRFRLRGENGQLKSTRVYTLIRTRFSWLFNHNIQNFSWDKDNALQRLTNQMRINPLILACQFDHGVLG